MAKYPFIVISTADQNSMVVYEFWLNFSCIILFSFCLSFAVTKEVASSGPYRATISSVKKCDKPSYSYMKNPPIILISNVVNMSNKIVLSLNITVLRDSKNVKLRLKSFVWANNKWRPNYIMNDIGCNGMLLDYILMSVRVKYDKDKCMFLKGRYQMDNVDINAIQHLWTTKMEYGKIMWRSEVFNPRLGTFVCDDYYTVTEPA